MGIAEGWAHKHHCMTIGRYRRHRPAPSRAALLGAALVLLLAIAAMLPVGALAAEPGSTVAAPAHSLLVSSTPADGATLKQPPDRVVLRFSDTIRDTGLGLTATGEAGAVPLADVAAAGRTLTADWPRASDSGEYAVNYRVVSADGHVISGSFAFTVKSPPNESRSASMSPDPAPSTTLTADNAEAAPHAVPGWVWLVLALVALAAIGLVVLRRGGPQR
ncbi:MAG: copper resistance protein CopC [Actinobacteria bacterium]|nr:copper resistance protein CopC [Actinomycetota bacterium]